jgi:hypothetical protein
MSRRNFPVTVKFVREYFATITVRARDQAEADKIAIDKFYGARADPTNERGDSGYLALGLPWTEHEPRTFGPEIDMTFRCVDCGKDVREGEYYMVSDELWAAAGMMPNGGMLCLFDLEERIGRWLTPADFTAVFPGAWDAHVAARVITTRSQSAQLDLFPEEETVMPPDGDALELARRAGPR